MLRIPNKFISTPQLNLNLTDGADPLTYFNIFIDEGILNPIINMTNRFAESELRKKPSTSKSKTKDWKNLDFPSLMLYIACMMIMGIDKKPNIDCYWSTDAIFSGGIIRSILSRDMFKKIKKYLRFAEPEPDSTDKLCKIRPFVDALRKKFIDSYSPCCQITIDEVLELWNGQLSWKQYHLLKRNRFGFKIFLGCESNYS